MAVTQLTDVIQRPQFGVLALHESLRKSALFDTGIVTPVPELTEKASANIGSDFEFDYFKDLVDSDPNQSTDDPTDVATPGNITTDKDVAVKIMRNNGWGSANLVASLSSTGDPMVAIANRIAAYWGRHYDLTAIATMNGIIADNIANDGGDMINDTLAVPVDFNAFADTAQTMGDQQDVLQVAVMHSAVFNKLTKDQVTNKVYDAQGNLLYQEFLGWRIIVSDSVNNAGGIYDTYVFRPGAFGWGVGAPRIQEEIEREAAQGEGEGVETLWSRRHFVMHPFGFQFLKASVAGQSPTNAELELAANWDRAVERKRVGIAVCRGPIA